MSKKPTVIGAPTKYKPDYCEMLIAHMEHGFSFESFAATIDVCEDTLYEWAKVHPEFSEAKKRARSKCRYAWEEMGLGSEMNPTIWIFNMKCRWPKEWRDVQEIKQETVHSVDPRLAELLDKKFDSLKKHLEE